MAFLGAGMLGLRSWFWHLATQPSLFMSLSLSFFMCYMRIKLTGCTSQGCKSYMS